MNSNQIIAIVIVLIILIVLIISTIFLLKRKNNKKESFQTGNTVPPSTCSATVSIEPNPITVIPGQPAMFRAYKDRVTYQSKNYLNHTIPSTCNWFQAGNIVNVNYNTNVVCTGYGPGSDGLMFFQLDIPLTGTGLPAFIANTNVIGNGIYTMIGYGNQELLTQPNYHVLQNGTVMAKKSASINNMVSLFCVQHYAGPPSWPNDHNGNDCYTYDVNVQFSYNI